MMFSEAFFKSEVLSEAPSSDRPSVRARTPLRVRPPVGFAGAVAAASAVSVLLVAQVAAPMVSNFAASSVGSTRDLGALVLSTKEPSQTVRLAAEIWNSPKRQRGSGRPIGELLAEIRASIS